MNLRPCGASRLKIVEIYFRCNIFLNTGQKKLWRFHLLGIAHQTRGRLNLERPMEPTIKEYT